MTVPLLTWHTPHCEYRQRGHTDAAKRISDMVTMHWLAMQFSVSGKWLAFRLQDGRGGRDVYPSKFDAVRHSSNPKQMLYVCMVPGGMNICEAEILLNTSRQMAHWGLEDSERQLIPRVAGEHRAAIARLLRPQ